MQRETEYKHSTYITADGRACAVLSEYLKVPIRAATSAAALRLLPGIKIGNGLNYDESEGICCDTSVPE
ncbi:hypothetical protein GCM10008922_03250 [Faecalicatena contorta]|nr:hypothetical protein CE91St64_13720 [Faecalicatena contorta]